jgi:hypothetical protein
VFPAARWLTRLPFEGLAHSAALEVLSRDVGGSARGQAKLSINDGKLF